MDRIAYRKFTKRLTSALQQHEQVIGLVAVGSMAECDDQPDEWSDHDFYIITHPGQQTVYRTQHDWLPDTDQIAWAYPETEHGVKVIYQNGHLLEYAVFDLDELKLAHTNHYRVLIDKGGIQQAMVTVESATRERFSGITDQFLAGQFLTNLLVGIRRYRRGERMSAQKFIKGSAVGHLVTLLSRYILPSHPDLADNIDPTRRFERLYPEIGRKLEALMQMPLPESARSQLALFEQYVGYDRLEVPAKVIETLREALNVGEAE